MQQTALAPVVNIHKPSKEETKLFQELKSIETEIDTIKSDVEKTRVQADWKIGYKLLEVRRRDIWRAESGKYRSFADYAEKRFGYSKQTSADYTRIAEKFTEAEAAGLSITQLWQLSKIPDKEERAKLTEDVRAGKVGTTRALADAVKTKRAEAGLNTERNGHVEKVMVSVRLEPGRVADGEFIKRKGETTIHGFFDLGEHRFKISYPEGRKAFEVFLLPPAEDE